ncbi:MAG: hypothetical protein EOM21_18945 [Gammaproteobacteria bacterium]|nr:hypothetical protein [Gammaproteobacteria bacterium]
MSWSENLAALADALTDPECFGESVTLPCGAAVHGVFVPDPAPQTLWGQPETPTLGGWGRAPRATPELYLEPADAADLKAQDRLEVRGTTYRIAKLDPPHDGLIRIELADTHADQEETAGAVWR